ncbi:hypothetical protein XELAEV_18033753mg [Xenopus laevis]|uniref:Uncharacterized protein n=1 Tax=Xenopus laevis TaxID=8355 RepID=A0A974CLH1_XENLA|nr:hypothetical protein XELAEV_18033753mg [Xenopus laevis]
MEHPLIGPMFKVWFIIRDKSSLLLFKWGAHPLDSWNYNQITCYILKIKDVDWSRPLTAWENMFEQADAIIKPILRFYKLLLNNSVSPKQSTYREWKRELKCIIPLLLWEKSLASIHKKICAMRIREMNYK